MMITMLVIVMMIATIIDVVDDDSDCNGEMIVVYDG